MQQSIVDAVEGLTHRERYRTLVAFGRDPTRHAALAPLETSANRYERQLWLMSTQGSRDAAAVARFISNETTTRLKWHAVRLASQIIDDAGILGMIKAFDDVMLQRVVLCLRRHGRVALVDRIVLAIELPADRTLVAALLRYCSAPVVERLIPDVLIRQNATEWCQTAALHPRVVAAELLKLARALEAPDHWLADVVHAVQQYIARAHADAAMDLAATILPLHHTHHRWRLSWALLFKYRPVRVAQLMADCKESVTDSLRCLPTRAMRKLDATLIRKVVGRSAVNAWTFLHQQFPTLRPAVRAELAEFVLELMGRATPHRDVMSCLPSTGLRKRECLLALKLPAVKASVSTQVDLAALLPWDDALALVSPQFSSPDAVLRATAGMALMRVAAFHSSRLNDALALVLARRNEQEPVRQRIVLTLLSETPVGRWEAQHLPALAEVFQSNLDSRDLSGAIVGSFTEFLVALNSHTPALGEWCCQWIVKIAPAAARLGIVINIGAREPNALLVKTIMPIFVQWRDNDQVALALAAIAPMKRSQIMRFPELSQFLLSLAQDPTIPATSNEEAFRILRALVPSIKRTAIPTLLERDTSWATQRVVQVHLLRQRQDLIGPFLSCPLITGRHYTGKARFLFTRTLRFDRLTFAQQTKLAASMAELPEDRVYEVMNILGRMELIEPTTLMQMARVDNPNKGVRDIALSFVARLDIGPEAQSVVMDALGDDRIRTAMYSVRKTLTKMRAEGALQLLRSVPMTKVTVAKEVIRLFGDVSGGAGLADLLRIGQDDKLHRDVHAALLRGLWPFLDRLEVRPLLERAAQSADVTVAGAAVLPVHLLSETMQSWCIEHVALPLFSHPDENLRCTAMASYMSIADPECKLLPRLREVLLQRRDAHPRREQMAAMSALLSLYVASPEVIVAVVRECLPYRALMNVAVLRELGNARNSSAPVVLAVVDTLKDQPHLATHRLLMMAECVADTDRFLALLEDVRRTDTLHGDVVSSVCACLARKVWPDAEAAAALELKLRSHTNERFRRIGLAMLQKLAQTSSWSTDHRAALEQYLADNSLLVRTAAWTILPPELAPDAPPQ